ncbi:MAG: hypothetical protein HKM88_00835 [Halobacteria archaeon]|nr:hypothetical protein [Halobacteria archaeon]
MMATLLYGVVGCCVLPRDDSMPVAGWVERAILFPDGLPVHAKLDTGAKTTSINAVDPIFFTRDSRRWVRFSLTSRQGQTIILERPVVRVATIKRHFSRTQERPVIKLDICIGAVRKMVEVNLVDRTGLNYQLLVGRNFLGSSLLVQSDRTYILSKSEKVGSTTKVEAEHNCF